MMQKKYYFHYDFSFKKVLLSLPYFFAICKKTIFKTCGESNSDSCCNQTIGCSFKCILKPGVEESTVNVPTRLSAK
jgi:hypothetical protein